MAKEVEMGVQDVIDLDAALLQFIKDCQNNQTDNKQNGGKTE